MNETAFLTLMAEHQGIIHKICRLYRDSREDREDLFQEITFQLWKSFPSFKGNSLISTWLYRIALNTAIASYRKEKPTIDYVETLPEFAEELQNEELILRQERLLTAIKQLSESEKAIIALYLDDLSYLQIAEILGISENNVGVKINRIKTKIQQLLIKES
ncbi:sigma-70 family RNA polymerase sigma factor [Runella sp. CRIBMP]|uniref:RNA polymerase sigma factor n=1 Tax=Runella sp. CRIBMP TaxID=2683261 RepID=UPI001412D2A4|nr:RNA polymerase sigma factor [Runella sp. CRIBMP]NBB20685.1 sigma-70 family RNA polymerase sigma factor [Runella sp. CRIBMP]